MSWPETPSDPPTRSVRLPSATVALSQVGEGPPLLFIHGVPGSGRDFRWLAPALEGASRVLRVDLPGFGGSPLDGPQQLELAERARVAGELLETLDLADVVLAGHSMGGPVAIEVARRWPQRVAGLALLASPGLRPHRLLRRVPLRLLLPLLRRPTLRRVLRAPLRAGYRAAGFSPRTPEPELLNGLEVARRLPFPRQRDNVAALQTPTFLAWTADDRLVEAAIGDELAAACPAGPRLRFDAGGHNLQKTQAVELAAALSAWLRELRGG